VRSDAGTELKNKLVKRLLDAQNIYHHVALNDDIKANYAKNRDVLVKMPTILLTDIFNSYVLDLNNSRQIDLNASNV